MKSPVRILSDLHLGHAASKVGDVESLRPLIEGAGTVIFNGDTWQELARAYRTASERLLSELKLLCESLNVEAVFISGNHDPGWPGTGWLELAEGRIVITHGDAVLWSGSPWSREVLSQQALIKQLWDEHLGAQDDAGERLNLAREMARSMRAVSYPKGRTIIHRVFDALNPPRRAVEILNLWLRHQEESAAFCRRYFPKAEILILGHFHRQGVWQCGDHLVINTGAFVKPHDALWVEWNDGWLTCGSIDHGTAWTMGKVSHVWRLPSLSC